MRAFSQKNQHAHHGKHEVEDPQQIHECTKIPIKIRQALMIQIWSHLRIIDETQGGSKRNRIPTKR